MGSNITTQVRNARNRARKLGRRADITTEEWQEALEDFDFSCAYCGRKYDDLKPYFTIDHYTPLATGGGSCIDNCVPSCVKCNSLKGNLSSEQVSHVPAERMQQIRRYLDARKRESGSRNCYVFLKRMRRRERGGVQWLSRKTVREVSSS